MYLRVDVATDREQWLEGNLTASTWDPGGERWAEEDEKETECLRGK